MHKLQLITRAPPHRSPRQEDADELIIPILDPHSRPVGSPVAPTEQPLAPGGAPQIRVVLRRTPGRGEELRVKLLTFLAGPQCDQTQIGIVLILARARRAAEIGGDRDPESLTALQHLVPVFMFLGFMSRSTAASFAIA